MSIAVCAGPDGARTYVNGKPVVRSGYVGTFDFVTKEVLLGVRAAEQYRGEIGDLRIWNRCLTEEAVTAPARR